MSEFYNANGLRYLPLFQQIFFLLRKGCFFVDLFVRVSNDIAVNMYKKLGYSVYRRVLDYYSGDPDEDAYGIMLFISVVYF